MRVNLIVLGCLVVLAVVLKLLWIRYWIWLPRLITEFNYPRLPNKDVVWKTVPIKELDRLTSQDYSRSNDPRPNVIVILADDLGFNDVSFYGGGLYNGLVQTPNIDALAKQGVAFSNAYAGHATCAPSRAALLTGRMPPKIGYEYLPITKEGGRVLGAYGTDVRRGVFFEENAVGLGTENMSLPQSELTIQRALKERARGYRTLQLGKWHLGSRTRRSKINEGKSKYKSSDTGETSDSEPPEALPPAYYFDESLHCDMIGLYLPVHHPEVRNCRFDDTLDQFLWANVLYHAVKDGEQPMEPRGYLTDYLAEEAAAAVHANKENPFFMYLAHVGVHTPLQALRADYEEFEGVEGLTHCDKVYAATIRALDRSVGTVVQAIEEAGLTNNTMIVFTSDNGGPNYIEQKHLNDPFRGWKFTFFEGGLRVPLFMKWPAAVPAGMVVHDEMVSHLDIFPTIMAAAGVDFDERRIDGVDLMSAVHRQTQLQALPKFGSEATEVEQNRTLFWRSNHYKAIVRRSRLSPELAVRYSGTDTTKVPIWKLSVSKHPLKMWLFNLLVDPGEVVNLSQDPHYAALLADLLAEMELINSQCREPLWKCVAELPISIDKITTEVEKPEDEYIYWPN